MSTDDRNPLEVLADSQAELNQLVTLDQSTKAFLKATWYQVNWADMLTPAPTAICIFGQLTLLAAVDDIALLEPKDGWKVVQYAQFQPAIAQLRLAGQQAFSKSYENMNKIVAQCTNMDAILTKTIDLITLKDTEDMTFEDKIALLKEDLPKRTRELSDSSAACIQASKDTTAEFQRCLDLATEINISVVATRGDEELKAKRNELERARLEAKLAAAAEDKERVKKELETSKEMLNRSEKRLQEASSHTLSGWEIFGMQVAEKVVDLAAKAGEQYLATMMTTRQIGLSAAQGLANKALSEMGGDNQPNGGGHTNGGNAAVKPELPKPIDGKVLLEASELKGYINYINIILKADKGSPNWKAIQADAKDPYSLAGQIAELAKIKLVSFDQSLQGKEAAYLANSAHEVASRFIGYAADQANKQEAIKSSISEFEALSTRADALGNEVELYRKTLGSQPKPDIGQATGQPDADDPAGSRKEQSAAQTAVKAAQDNLKLATESFNIQTDAQSKLSDTMHNVTTELASFTAELAALDTTKVEWQAINNMLFNSIGYLDRLCTQLTFLEEFFAVINNIISINLKHACDQVIAGDKDVLGTLVTLKYSMFDLRRKTLLGDIRLCNNARYVVNRIALTYNDVYKREITEGMLLLGEMSSKEQNEAHKGGAKAGSNAPAGLSHDELVSKGQKLSKWAAEASDKMLDMLKEDLKSFNEEIGTDVGEYKSKIEKAIESMPKLSPPAIKEIEKAVDNGQKRANDTVVATAPAKGLLGVKRHGIKDEPEDD